MLWITLPNRFELNIIHIVTLNKGFTKQITLPTAKWQGYLKDYMEVTLMECKIESNIDYLRVPELIAYQKMV
jgi:histone acetyltransferase